MTKSPTMSGDDIKAYVAEHPRTIGILFALMILLTQAGNAAAAWLSSPAGT